MVKYGARKNCVNYGLQVLYFCFILQGGVQILQVGPESCQNKHGFHHFNPFTQHKFNHQRNFV